jgi:hypothetical protein
MRWQPMIDCAGMSSVEQSCWKLERARRQTLRPQLTASSHRAPIGNFPARTAGARPAIAYVREDRARDERADVRFDKSRTSAHCRRLWSGIFVFQSIDLLAKAVLCGIVNVGRH